MMLIEVFSLIVVGAGVLFCAVAALGLLIMPDIFLRMSASTKAATMGVGLILLAAALSAEDLGEATRAIAIVIFLFLTAPVAAHMIGRAAYFEPDADGTPPVWDQTKPDELKERYNFITHELHSTEANGEKLVSTGQLNRQKLEEKRQQEDSA